jgi:LCP family protein required for cell wall assembly
MKSFFKKLTKNFPKDRLTQILLGVLILLAVAGAVYGFSLSRKLVATNETFSLPGDPVLKDEINTEGSSDPESGDLVLNEPPSADLPSPDTWDGVTRVNVLVMGLDYRDWEAGSDIPRTDTMILLTLDPLNNTAGIVSIPRDLWVSIPGFEYGKINTAYSLGELYNLPGGGAGLAAQTVEELLGVPVQYYAQVDFQSFVDFIDHIDGIKVTFEEDIILDRRGSNNTVKIDAGTYTIPGEYALAYARTRGTEGGDFDRSSRQQIVIMAIRDRILEFNMLPKLVANAPALYNDLASGIQTNMSLNDVIKLAWSAIEVDRNAIKQVVISNEYITFGTSPDGLDILRAIPDKIRILRDQVFGNGAALGPVAEGDLLSLALQEGARISVRNGSYQAEVATQASEILRGYGFNVVEEVNTNSTPTTQIYIYNTTPYTLRLFSETLGISSNNIFFSYEPQQAFDILLVLGDDMVNQDFLP